MLAFDVPFKGIIRFQKLPALFALESAGTVSGNVPVQVLGCAEEF
jgi:hypothetical protein